jgi:twinkle protein
MACVDRLPHTCGTSDALQVFEVDGKYTGFCFNPKCLTYVHDPYGDKPDDWVRPVAKLKKSAEQRARELIEIQEEWGVSDLPSRFLKKEYLDYYGMKVGTSEQDGVTPVITAAPIHRGGELVSYQLRLLEEKRMWSLGDSGNADLFGLQQAIASGAPRLIITEGQYDAVALFQVLKELNSDPRFASFNPAVVSLSNGSGAAAKEITKALPIIKAHFKDVVLAFDMDAAGDEAAQQVCKIFPAAMRATLPAKDANAALEEGRSKALKNSVLFNADKPKNSRLVYGGSLREAAKQEAKFGDPFPWVGLTKLTRGERLGETYYWGAGVKMGKSEVVDTLSTFNILHNHQKVMVAKPEQANARTYKMMVGKAANRIFHDPEIPFDHEAFDKFEPLIADNVVMLNLYQHMSWENVKADIIHAGSEGYGKIYLDPVTNFTNQMSSGEANEVLVGIAADAASMALDHNLTIHFFCHLNAPPRGSDPHELGGKIFSNQFAGSRAMMRSCNYMIGVEGNKSSDLSVEERNCRDLVVLEDREFGQVGRVPLYWDNQTGVFNDRYTCSIGRSFRADIRCTSHAYHRSSP